MDLLAGKEVTAEEHAWAGKGINDLLVSMGHQPEDIAGWWTFVRFAALDGRTPVQAWAAGNHDGVADLVVHLYQRSEENAWAVARDAARVAAVRQGA